MFVDREKELRALRERWKRGKAELIIVYGRRRVGKTAILKEFLGEAGGVYLLGRQQSEMDHLRRFSQVLAEHFGDKFVEKSPFANWDAFFEYIHQKAVKERVTVVFDEFPYVVAGSPHLPSVIQDYWDSKLHSTKVFMVLCGSSIGMMEELLGARSPLYGRRTGQIQVKPFPFGSARLFFPRYDFREQIVAYAILGGTPGYLVQFEDKLSVFDNIREKILRTDAFLYQDPVFVLREEVEEPRYYFSILRAIAHGRTKLGEIINATGLPRGLVAKYLSTLSDLQIVEREVPVTERRPEKSRRGIYKIRDNYFRFWFRYVHTHMDEIEMGETGYVMKAIRRDINTFVSQTFEDVCREALQKLNVSRKLPFTFTKIGRWWRGDQEIDVVAVNQETGEMLVAECKWREKPASPRDVADMMRKAENVEWTGGEGEKRFAYFSSGGFTEAALGLCKEEKVLAFDLAALEEVFSEGRTSAMKGKPPQQVQD